MAGVGWYMLPLSSLHLRGAYSSLMAHNPNAGTVLIVEDDPNTREAMKCLIESHGHVVATARDGNEALSVLRSGMRPCLIVLDLTLPNKDGFQFRRDQR